VVDVFYHLHVSSGSLRASEVLFRGMTSRVLRMPLLWIDNTPLGDMLKRFTVNIRLVDDSLLSTLSEVVTFGLRLVIIVTVG